MNNLKNKLVNIAKYSKPVYLAYYYLLSTGINLLKLVTKPDDKLILFNSFAGRKFDDSPKELFEEIKKDPRFKNYKLVWAFHEPQNYNVSGADKIKTDGIKYFKTALKARVWITNSSVERGLNFKGKNTIYLNTWHGTPMKKMGTDIKQDNKAFKTKGKNSFDIFNAQSTFEADIFSRVFNVPRDKFLEVGLPRNDKLKNATIEEIEEIKTKLDIPKDKKVILYCPTFREYEKDENMGCVLCPPMDLKKWESNIKDDYVLLIRAHYEVSKVMEIEETQTIRNVTNYPSLNDLMLASDILISDYSSVFFDYSITNKPMLHFTYDYDKYSQNRGMYFDIRDYLRGANKEDEILNLIREDHEEDIRRTKEFQNKYVNYSGEATKKTVEHLAKLLGETN